VVLRWPLDPGVLVEVGTALPGEALIHIDVVKDLEERILSALRRLHAHPRFATACDRPKVQAPLAYLGTRKQVMLVCQYLDRIGLTSPESPALPGTMTATPRDLPCPPNRTRNWPAATAKSAASPSRCARH
jgi:hypothetical protein